MISARARRPREPGTRRPPSLACRSLLGALWVPGGVGALTRLPPTALGSASELMGWDADSLFGGLAAFGDGLDASALQQELELGSPLIFKGDTGEGV